MELLALSSSWLFRVINVENGPYQMIRFPASMLDES